MKHKISAFLTHSKILLKKNGECVYEIIFEKNEFFMSLVDNNALFG